MGKSTGSASSKRRNRLLTFFGVCALLFICPPALTGQNTDALHFYQTATFTVAENSEFTVEIAEISPANIEILYRDLPTAVSFVSSKKSDTFIMDKDGNREKGTLISYTVRFLEPGMYNLDSLDILIDSISYTISFPPVEVNQNTNFLLPELYLEPQGNLYQSQRGILVLSGRYFQRIENLEWNLSENALIDKSISSMPIPSDDFPFSENKTDIAIFSYTPLSVGTLTLPQITATFIAYNGSTYTVQPKLKTVTVLPSAPEKSELPAVGDSTQLDSSTQSISVAQSVIPTQKENTAFVKKLVALRSQERHTLFPFMAKKERIVLEETANIQNIDETSELWALISVALSVIGLLLGFILHKTQKAKQNAQKSRLPLLCFTIAAVLVFFALFSTFKLSGQYALALGSQLRTIPEYEASTLTTLSAGMRVRIVRTGGDWYLVSLEDTRSGWILKNDCILIN